MKMPNKVRLVKWYRELLALDVRLNVIFSYKDIRKYSRCQCWQGIEKIPRLNGDLWIARLSEVTHTATRVGDKVCKELITCPRNKISKNDQQARLWSLMDVQIKGFSSEYFVINLTESDVGYDTSTERENEIPLHWINSRHLLVDFFWEQMLEFSDERQAQFSLHSLPYSVDGER